jgi:hypothetical protein
LVLRPILACAILLALPASAMGAGMSLSGPGTVTEAAGMATYTVECGDTANPVPVLPPVPNTGPLNVAAADGPAPATQPADHGAPSQPLVTCSIATTSFTIDVPITNDTADELNEKFTVSASGVLVAEGSVSDSVTTTITDDDPLASIVPVAFVVEGNSGTSAVELAVTLSSVAAQATTIAFETEDLTAVAGSDYTATSGNVVIPAGQQARTISVPIIGDTAAEGPEGFFVNLTSTDNGSLLSSGRQGGVGIVDDDVHSDSLPGVSLPKSVSIEEGNAGTGNVLFDVKLSVAAPARTEISWKTSNFSANNADYEAANGKVVFQKGQRTKTISVDVKGDKRDEPDEAFVLMLSNPVGVSLLSKGAFGVIEDDDGPKMKIKKARVRGKDLVTKIVCPESASRCRGKLVGKAGRLRLGREEFDLQAGDSQKLFLRMSKKARTALRDHGLRAKLVAITSDADGDTSVTKKKSRLKRRR